MLGSDPHLHDVFAVVEFRTSHRGRAGREGPGELSRRASVRVMRPPRTRTLRPQRAISMATAAPAQRAPTTSASYRE